ncbi:MAG TPA: beta-N-acetylhexosaminidase [Candidatus Polarisedimenticolia bacterium]|jgi:beta-N-acetylhexosaminidase|nr:beta-N-acetylhexosaminidase [Candidatus Polarisedimenticolia bacterium]
MSVQSFPQDEKDQAGQLLFVGFEGSVMNSSLERDLRRIRPGGIILFSRNLKDASQVADFCRALQGLSAIPPFLAIDQEGGRVSRLKGIFPPIPANLPMSRSRDAGSLIGEHGRMTGRGLALLGFNLNFAPVLDLSAADSPNGIGDRAYGEDPETVAPLARAFLEGQREAGVLGCGKHFPGLGGGNVDSHLDLPRIERPADALWKQDLAPYRRLREVLPMVMVGHAYYPALQGSTRGPATLSRALVTDLLRSRIGYPGVVVTDDLEMGAVDQKRPAGDVVREAIEAGNDLVMYCNSWERVEEAHASLARALKTGRIGRARLESILTRVLALKKSLAGPRQTPGFDAAAFEEVCRSLGSLEGRLTA